MKTKVTRMKTYYANMNKRKAKLVEENRKGLQYSSGLVGPFPEDGREGNYNNKEGKKRTNKRNKEKAATSKCPKCGIMGHTRTNSLACLMNKDNLARAKAREKVSLDYLV